MHRPAFGPGIWQAGQGAARRGEAGLGSAWQG